MNEKSQGHATLGAVEFGKLANVDDVDWTVSADDPATTAFLQRQKPAAPETQLFIGAPAWGHAQWIGKIYPEGTKRTEYLAHYAKYFNGIELNTSHYRIPNADVVDSWLKQVPPEFRFCPKVFQGLSHARNGLLDRKLQDEWFTFLRRLGANAGPSFLQLPPHFDYSRKAELFEFLKHWPADFELALEFRHPTWFDGGRVLPALTAYLQSRGIGLVITDVAGRRDLAHASIGADFSMLRFIGNNLHPSDFARAEAWVRRFAGWRALGLRRIFLMVHEPDDVSVPEMTEYFRGLFEKNGGWTLPEKTTVRKSPQLTLGMA